jgi:hypothetical protein
MWGVGASRRETHRMFCHQGRPSHKSSSCLPGSVSTRSDVNPLQVEIARGCACVKPIVYADHQHAHSQSAGSHYLSIDTREFKSLIKVSAYNGQLQKCSRKPESPTCDIQVRLRLITSRSWSMAISERSHFRVSPVAVPFEIEGVVWIHCAAFIREIRALLAFELILPPLTATTRRTSHLRPSFVGQNSHW